MATPAKSNPACSLSDFGQAIKDTYDNVPSSCAAQAADPVFYGLTAFMIALTQTPQGVDFCNSAENFQKTAADDIKKATEKWNALPADLKDKIGELVPALNSLGDTASDASGALNLVSCACQTAMWKGPGELFGDFGDCAADALCAAQHWLHDHVAAFSDCTPGSPPKPPQLIDCRVDPRPKNPDGSYQRDASGTVVFDMTNNPIVGANTQCFSHGGFICRGSFCFPVDIDDPSVASPGTGNYCYCPPEMQHWDQYGLTDGSCIGFVQCKCPGASHPLSDGPAGAYICVCDDGQHVGADGECPAPVKKCDCDCPNNQVVLSVDQKSCNCSCGCKPGEVNLGGSCAAPCTNPTDIMLASGACCEPGQAAACGECCPVGMHPDPTTGGCIAAILQPTTSVMPVKPVSPNAPVENAPVRRTGKP